MMNDPRLQALGPVDPDLDADIASLEGEIAQMQPELPDNPVPEGDFSLKSLTKFTKALNDLLSALDLQEVEVPQEETTIFPPDVADAFSMIQQAVADAVAQDVLDEEATLVSPANDQELNQTTARIKMIARDRGFRRWMTENVEAPAEPANEATPPEAPTTEPTPDEIDALFAARA